MMRAVPLILLLLLALGLAACGDEAGSSLTGDLRYVRSGGFAGDHDVLVVRPDGSATLKSRRGGERSFELTETEREELAHQVQGWGAGPAWGRSPKPAPDAFVHTVEYEGHKETTDDAVDHGRIALVETLGRILAAHR